MSLRDNIHYFKVGLSTMRIFCINIPDIDKNKTGVYVVWLFLWNVSWKKIICQSSGWLVQTVEW